jgi:hypothetical protein
VAWELPDAHRDEPIVPGPPQLLCPVDVGGRRLLATAGTGPLIRMWDRDTGAPADPVAVHSGRVVSLCPLTIGGRALVASASVDGRVMVWDPVTGAAVHATSVAVSRGRRGEPPVEIAEVMPGSPGGGVWPARPALLHLRLPSGGWLWDPVRDTVIAEPEGRPVDSEHYLTSIGGSAGWVTVGGIRSLRRGRGLQVVVQDGETGGAWLRAGLEVDRAVAAGWTRRERRVLRHALNVPHAVLLITRDVRADLGRADLLTWWLAGDRATPLHTLRCDAEAPSLLDETGYRPVLAVGTSPARVYNPENGEQLTEYSGHDVPVDRLTSLRAAGDSLIASGDRNGRVCVWRPVGGATLYQVDVAAPVLGLAAADDALFVAHGNGLTALTLDDR